MLYHQSPCRPKEEPLLLPFEKDLKTSSSASKCSAVAMKIAPYRLLWKNYSHGGKCHPRDHSSSVFVWSSNFAFPGNNTAPAVENFSARAAIEAPIKIAKPIPKGAPVNGRVRLFDSYPVSSCVKPSKIKGTQSKTPHPSHARVRQFRA